MTEEPLSAAAKRLAATPRRPGGPALRPRDAATLILIDRSDDRPKVLMGRRHQRHVFMPGKFVFPGGRVEPSDARMPVAAPLAPEVEAQLLKAVGRPSPARARALALAAIRETFEETGLLLGKRTNEPVSAPAEGWHGFVQSKVRPDLSRLRLIARAVTPPGRVRRFDARFFAADAAGIAHRIDGLVGEDAEFVELVWLPVAEARSLELVTITQVVLEELDACIAEGFPLGRPVPFYRMLRGRFVRELL